MEIIAASLPVLIPLCLSVVPLPDLPVDDLVGYLVAEIPFGSRHRHYGLAQLYMLHRAIGKLLPLLLIELEEGVELALLGLPHLVMVPASEPAAQDRRAELLGYKPAWSRMCPDVIDGLTLIREGVGLQSLAVAFKERKISLLSQHCVSHKIKLQLFKFTPIPPIG